jgi:hypothetical protein
MKKTLLTVALLMTSSFSHASIGDRDYFYNQPHQNRAVNQLESTRGQLEGSKKSSPEMYERFLKQLEQKDSRFINYWNKKSEWNGNVVYQNNSLFDMERFETISPKLQSYNRGIVDYTSSSIISSGIDFENSVTKMMHGKPAIGPDNKEIVLCRMVNAANAPYFEMSKTDFDVVYGLAGSRTPQGVLCLRSLFASSYWKQRKADFIDYAGDIVQPWR